MGDRGSTFLTALEGLTAGASVRGLLTSNVVTVETAQRTGEQAIKGIFREYVGHQVRLRPADRSRAHRAVGGGQIAAPLCRCGHPCGGAIGKYSGPVAVHST